jgi:hypothetical protein
MQWWLYGALSQVNHNGQAKEMAANWVTKSDGKHAEDVHGGAWKGLASCGT